MHKTDGLELDGRLLNIFVTIYETSSVSEAANILSLNQSTVSHALEKLRKICNDKLFVRAGRGITPTTRAHQLAIQAKTILQQMQEFVAQDEYDPLLDSNPLTIFASDYEIDTIVKPFYTRLRKLAPGIRLHLKQTPSSSELPKYLREGVADIALGPSLDGLETDIVQQVVLEDSEVCFFDDQYRTAPNTIAKYVNARHVMMVLGSIRKNEIDDKLLEHGKYRCVQVECMAFAAVAEFIRETELIATMPSRFSKTLFRDLSSCPPPIKLKPFKIVQTWHVRHSQSPRHQWIRKLLKIGD